MPSSPTLSLTRSLEERDTDEPTSLALALPAGQPRFRRAGARHRARPDLEHLEGRALPASASLLGVMIPYTIPTPNSQPQDVALGPDGNLWFTESAGNKIGRLTPSGSFLEFAVPTANSMPYSIVNGSDATGNLVLFFAEYQGGKLGAITTTGFITEGAVVDSNNNPVPGTQLVDLAVTEPGFAQVTQNNSRELALFDLSVTPPSYAIPRAGYPPPESSTDNSGNSGVAIDLSNRVYFAESNTDKIGVYSVNANTGTGATIEYPVAGGKDPTAMTLASDGNIWFTYTNASSGGGELGRFNVSSQTISTFDVPSGKVPTGLAAQMDGSDIYFTTGTTIGRINVTNGFIEEDTQTLSSAGSPRGVTIGPDDDPWFVLGASNQVVEYRPIAFVNHNIPTAGSNPMRDHAGAGRQHLVHRVSDRQVRPHRHDRRLDPGVRCPRQGYAERDHDRTGQQPLDHADRRPGEPVSRAGRGVERGPAEPLPRARRIGPGFSRDPGADHRGPEREPLVHRSFVRPEWWRHRGGRPTDDHERPAGRRHDRRQRHEPRRHRWPDGDHVRHQWQRLDCVRKQLRRRRPIPPASCRSLRTGR